jgi:hypothetical protein
MLQIIAMPKKRNLKMAGLEDVVRDIASSDKEIGKAIARNPEYLNLLKSHVEKAYLDSIGTLRGAGLVDRWTKLTTMGRKTIPAVLSNVGAAAGSLTPLGPLGGWIGKKLGKLSAIPAYIYGKSAELIPKALYAPYYLAKTGDLLSVPYWLLSETIGLLPGRSGELIAMNNNYVGRAVEGIKRKAKRDFHKSMREIQFRGDDLARNANVDKLFADWEITPQREAA